MFILDAARLAAALMVVAWHLVAIGAWDGQSPGALFGQLYRFARYGWLGVELFFLISGFVICMSAWGRTVGEFAISRVARLFPGYWFAVLATAGVLVAWPVLRPPPTAVDVAGNLTMFQRFLAIRDLDLSYWTLPVEMIFYLLFAIVVARGLTYRRVVAFCVIWTAVSLTVAFLQGLHTMVPAVTVPGLAGALDAGYSGYFVAGVLLYLVHRFGSSLLLWGLVGICWLICLVRIDNSTIGGMPMRYWPEAVAVTAFFAFLSAVALGWFSWFRWRWAVTAGALTYPLYLIHQVVGLTAIRLLHPYAPPWLLLGAVVGALLVVAWLIHRCVERPLSRWLRRRLTADLHRMRSGIGSLVRQRRSDSRLPILDLLRLGAAAMVLCAFLVSSDAWGQPARALFGRFEAVSRYGWLGIELFFLVSGFAIGLSAWRRSVGEFAVARVVRVYPAYWFAVLATAAVVLTTTGSRPSMSDIAVNLTMFPGLLGVPSVNATYVTLAVGALFCLLVAIVVARGVTYRRLLAFCFLWTVGSLVVPTLGPATPFDSAYPCCFIAGVLLCLAHRVGANPLLLGLVGLNWLIALTRVGNDRVAGFQGRPSVEMLAVTLFFAVMTAVALGWFSWLRWRAAVVLGAVSYPAYLIHPVLAPIVIKAVQPYAPARAVFAGAVVAVLVAAWLVHRFVERPVASWLERHLALALQRIRRDDRLASIGTARPAED